MHIRSLARLHLGASIAGLAILIGACGQPGSQALQIVDVQATSQSSVVVVFDLAVNDAALEADNYAITAPDQSRLLVLAAYRLDNLTVVLATEPQQLVRYDLVVNHIGGPGMSATQLEAQGAFDGSAASAPAVASAVALSNSSVLVSFVDPADNSSVNMGSSALLPEHYLIDGLDVYGVAYGSNGADRSRVVLTTSSMSDQQYTAQVAGVLSLSGNRLVDPFLNVGDFRGIPQGDQVPPEVLDAYATGNTTVVLRFSEPVSSNAADPTGYLVLDSGDAVLTVAGAKLNEYGTEATLTTWPMTAGVEYRLTTVSGVTDTSGNALTIDAAAPPRFVGAAVDAGNDTLPPRVLGANSISSTQIVVTFSEPVYGADDPKKYSIADRASFEPGVVTTQAVLRVESATVSANRRSVTLTTRQQTEIL
ncbi:MAG TPA: Ig-like domain-containing protein, partial [Trueperaceae bacterium]|nr:Ig-like domain-containing protein [Trueperaceae bacterium]